MKQDASIGTNILRVSASDEDADNNGAIVYSLTAPVNPNDLEYFEIQAESGWIVLKKPLDVSALVCLLLFPCQIPLRCSQGSLLLFIVRRLILLLPSHCPIHPMIIIPCIYSANTIILLIIIPPLKEWPIFLSQSFSPANKINMQVPLLIIQMVGGPFLSLLSV